MAAGLLVSQDRLAGGGLEVVVDLVGPVSHPSDVDTEVVRVLRGRADGEGMPLVDGDGGDLDEAPVPRAVVELGRLLDPQRRHPGEGLSTSMSRTVPRCCYASNLVP